MHLIHTIFQKQDKTKERREEGGGGKHPSQLRSKTFPMSFSEETYSKDGLGEFPTTMTTEAASGKRETRPVNIKV